MFSAGAVVPVLLCWWGYTSKAFYVASVGYNMCPVVPVRHCTRISRHRVAMPVASQLSPPTLVNMQRTQAALRLVAPSGLPCVLADWIQLLPCLPTRRSANVETACWRRYLSLDCIAEVSKRVVIMQLAWQKVDVGNTLCAFCHLVTLVRQQC